MSGVPSSGPSARAAYTVSYRVRRAEGETLLVRYATESYVVTRCADSLSLFRADDGARYEVDPVRRRLRPVDGAARAARARRLRLSIGPVRVELDPGEERIGGFRCLHRSVHSEGGYVVAVGELYCTRLPGLERTALDRERRAERTLRPLDLPLRPDELTVLSSVKVLASDFEESESWELIGVEGRIDDLAFFDRLLTFDRTA